MNDSVDATDSLSNATSSSVFSPTPSVPVSPAAAAASNDDLKVRSSSDSFDSGYHPSTSTPSSNGASATVTAGSNRTEDAVVLYQGGNSIAIKSLWAIFGANFRRLAWRFLRLFQIHVLINLSTYLTF